MSPHEAVLTCIFSGLIAAGFIGGVALGFHWGKRSTIDFYRRVADMTPGNKVPMIPRSKSP